MAFGLPDRLALELVNQELLYATNSVISATSQEPLYPSEGDAYIVPPGGWDSDDLGNYIAYFDGENFLTMPPRTSQLIFVQDILGFLTFTGTAWVTFSPPFVMTIGAALTGGINKGLLYDNAGALGNLSTANNGVLVTSASGVPSISTTLPTALALQTPASINLSNAIALPVSTGVSGLGTSVATALGINVGSAGSFVVNGGVLGTPSSGVLTNVTGLPVSTGISGLAAGIATFLATPSSANLAAALTDETGTGSAVFANSPIILFNTVTKTANYAVGATDYTIRADATSGAFAITLPAVATSKRMIVVKKIDATANGVTVSGDGNIDGAPSYILAFSMQSITLQSNGVTWDVL
jgi:hypothetical protein